MSLAPTSARRGRVLCVTSNFPRWQGDSTTPFVLTLAHDLQALGWQVDVLAPHAPGAARQETLDGIQVERFRYCWPETRQTVCYQGGAMVNLRNRPLEKLKLPALVGAETLALTRRLISGQYDLLHAHWILPQGFTGMLATGIARLPHVITVHGGDIFSLRGRLMTRLKRAALHSAQTVTVNSSATEQATRAIAPDIARLQRIPMGVNTAPLDAREQTRANAIRAQHGQAHGPLLIFVGRLVDEKGAADAISAVPLIQRTHPGVRLLIVGEGPDRRALAQQANQLGLHHQVRFLGWVDANEVRAHMAAADIFLGPSRTAANGWVEAQGLTMLEAMAIGTPVVASRLGGIVDSVIDEQTGLLVDERSPAQLANAVMRIAANPALAKTLTEQAQQHAQQTFSREASASAFSRLYETLCQAARTQHR